MTIQDIPPPLFRALVALIVGAVALAAVKLGLDQEQTAAVLGLVAMAAGESGLRQPPPPRGGGGVAGGSTLLILLALLSAGCSGTLGAARAESRVGLAPDSPRCRELDDRHATWSGLAEGSALLAGGSGLATVADDDPRLRTGLAVGAVAAGAVAAFSTAMAQGTATAWSRECTQ